MQRRWLTPDQQRAWRGYVRMQGELAAVLNRQLQQGSGLSLADYAVLVELNERSDGQARPTELARSLRWEQSRLSHQVARMARRGLVRREGCGADGRGAFLSITPTGRDALDQAAPGHVTAVLELMFDGLEPAQEQLLADLTDRVLQRLAARGCGEADGQMFEPSAGAAGAGAVSPGPVGGDSSSPSV